MAIEYIIIPENKKENGMIALSKHVLEAIAGYAIEEEEDNGCYLAPKTTFRRPVFCKVANNHLSISIDVKLQYGLNINTTCEMIQNKVYQVMQQMTDIKCDDIKINVVGFVF